MEFVVLPVADALDMGINIEYSRKNLLKTQVLLHKEFILEAYEKLGQVIQTLDENDNPIIQYPDILYPVYDSNSEELDNLLNSSDWSSPEF